MGIIYGTVIEAMAVQKRLSSNKVEHTVLIKEEATSSAVLKAMEKHSFLHIACHGLQISKNPLRSSLFLKGEQLTLEIIIRKDIGQRAQLAFLSACETGTGSKTLPDESAHLAAGMLAAGYRGCVATMWEMMDHSGPEIAGAFYDKMAEMGEERSMGRKGMMYTDDAAYALHYAVWKWRDTVRRKGSRNRYDPYDFASWVMFVHYGI